MILSALSDQLDSLGSALLGLSIHQAGVEFPPDLYIRWLWLQVTLAAGSTHLYLRCSRQKDINNK